MAFGVISTFYFPIAGSAGASLWGTDVRKLNSSADASADATTVFNHGTGGATTRTADPYTTSAADSDQTLFGWAIAPTDMGSTADFVRSMAAGNHVLTARMNNSALSAVVANVTLFAYRVGAAPTRTRTLLGSVTVATPSLPAVGAVTTVTVTLALPAITFGPDETIQYSFECNATGVAITGRNIQFRTGTDGGVAVRMDTPPLNILAGSTGTSSGTATADGSLSAVAGMTGAAAGTAVAVGAPTAITSFEGTASGSATTAGVLGATAGLVGSSSATSSAEGALGATAGLTGSSSGSAVAEGALAATAGLIGSAAGSSTAEGFPAALAGTIGSAAGTSVADGVLGAVLATTGTAGSECPECPGGDWSPNDGAKSISGTVYDHETGDPVGAGVPVWLIRDSDGYMIGPVATDVSSQFSFPRDSADPYTYHTYVTYVSGPEQIHGVSDTGQAPS